MCCAYPHHHRRHHSDLHHPLAQLVPRLHSWLHCRRRPHRQEVVDRQHRCHQIHHRRRHQTCRYTNQLPNPALHRYRHNHPWLLDPSVRRCHPSSYCPGFLRRHHHRRLPSSVHHLSFHFQSCLRNPPTPVGKRSNLNRGHPGHHLLWIQTHLMRHPWNRRH